jgi:hypothetical protein
MEAYLHEAALKLEAWGFPEPTLGRTVETPDGRTAYRVFLHDAHDEGVGGEYHHPHCFGPGIIRLMITIDRSETTAIVEGRPTVLPFGFEAMGHELFHAVQYSMPFFDPQCKQRVGDWITEGTARAVGVDLTRLIMPPGVSDWGARRYNRRLPVPLRKSLLPENEQIDAVDPYATSSFWRYLAEMHAAGGKPRGIGPYEGVDYSFMRRLFETRPARDCDSEGARCGAELTWLNDRLIRLFGRNLRQVFPLFIETLGMYGERGGRGPGWDSLGLDAGRGSPGPLVQRKRRQWLGQCGVFLLRNRGRPRDPLPGRVGSNCGTRPGRHHVHRDRRGCHRFVQDRPGRLRGWS